MERILPDEHIGTVVKLSHELAVKAYLAGGGVRDLLLGRRLKDMDFALAGMAGEFPRMFAERIGGRFFWLDRERAQARVAKRTEEGILTFDFAPLRGKDIVEDLELRDFTINAMALELSGENAFIDPLRGEDDLREGVLRRCAPSSFEDDPLRLLRGIRFAATLGFVIEGDTWDDIGKNAELLERVAAERIRDEFFQILAAPRVGASLKMLRDSGLMARIIPETMRGKVDETATAGQIARAVRVEEILDGLPVYFPEYSRQMAPHLGREMEGGITSCSILKLAALIGGGAASGNAGAWADRLRLGRKAARILSLLASETGPLFEPLSTRPARRAMFRFFRDHEPAGVELAIVALVREEVPQRLCTELFRYYFRDYDPLEDGLLLSGGEIMGILGIDEGLAVGEAMERLKEAERLGLVNCREEAREFLRKNLLTRGEPMR